MRTPRLGVFALAATVIAGCGEPIGPEPTAEEGAAPAGAETDPFFGELEPSAAPEMVEKLINGVFTQERPEVGTSLVNGGMCTATLIRRNVAVTAAHCVDYRTADRPGASLGTFTVEALDGAEHRFRIDGYRSYSRSNEPGSKDVALIRLAEPVPGALARPAALAERFPNAGEQVLWMGYGCGRRGFSDDHSGRKQKIVFDFRQTDNSCPGDSGGPSFLGLSGPVFRVTSGYYTNGGGDIFGDVVAVRPQLTQQADTWSAAYPDESPPDGGGEVDPDDGGGDVAPAPPPVPEAPDGPTVEYPDIAQTYLRGLWVALEWKPVSNAGRYAVVLMGRAPDGTWAYTARFDPGKDTDRGTKYAWLSARELCAKMPAATAGQSLLLSAEVRPDDVKARARRAPVPQPLVCP
ncbi:S1 family peptidase [Myxococcota bacterium]|nr:S1 family peptidase [Myxococcota bacterium]